MGTSLIPAYCSGISLQKQIHDSKLNPSPDSFDIWWLGQSGFLLQWNGKCVLFDPYLSDSLTTKYASTDKPHVRMSERVIDPAFLNEIDIVTTSHNHTDHLDAETLIPLLNVNPGMKFVIPEANRDFICDRVKCARDFPIGLNDGLQISIGDFTFHGVPAAHNTIERDEQGRCKFMGFVVEFGVWSIYHSGDTLWYPGIVETLAPFGLDVAFLPINGNDPARKVAGNLNAAEAARLGLMTGTRLVIPHHYHMFEFNTADPKEFALQAGIANQPFRILRPGERFCYS
jgi:L-ascorbate metabolism protein UlaG (beta-lactamase superfamily)